MCIFTGPVKSVAKTQIFARRSSAGGQFLVYSMQYQADAALAMILPLPTAASAGEEAVRFIDLSGYPGFFLDLARGFWDSGVGRVSRAKGAPAAAPLRVHEVGSFEASFVPSLADFSRLDARFRLPDGLWEGLPIYADYGFAVFKLKAGERKVHPMAFEFASRDRRQLFFPTVHIHDGQIAERARGVVDPGSTVLRREIRGHRRNKDVWAEDG